MSLKKKAYQVYKNHSFLTALKILFRKGSRRIYLETKYYLQYYSYQPVHALIFPILLRSYQKKITPLAQSSQLFLLGRQDFGTFLVQTHYAACWQTMRCQTTIIIATAHFPLVLSIQKKLSPNSNVVYPNLFLFKILIFLFSKSVVHLTTFSKLFLYCMGKYPNSIHIYEQLIQKKKKRNTKNHSNYISFLDKDVELHKNIFSPRFIQAYLDIRKQFDYRQNFYKDFIYLQSQNISFSSACNSTLLSKLKITRPYVVININTKLYSKDPLLNKKQIEFPQRYNVIITILIEKGYFVVLQGRNEQPFFKTRKGFIDYAHSPYISVENDLELYSGAEFAISTKSGPENFSAAFQIPLLGLDYVELCSMTGNPKLRFFPKILQRRSTQEKINWKELLTHPFFFDLGPNFYDSDLEYLQLTEEELFFALQEFLTFITGKRKWNEYSSLQNEFRKNLTPLHLDLFDIPGLPLDNYLEGNK